MEDVLRVIFVFERGQPRKLIRRIGPTNSFGAFIAQRVDVLPFGEGIESRGRTPCERDSSVVFGRVCPAARGDVFEGGISKGERGLLIRHLGDRTAIRLQADIWETTGRCVGAALQ
jgi:hypothetical protein